MKKLKIILLSSLIVLLLIRINNVINYKSIYKSNNIDIIGRIENIDIGSYYTKIIINNKKEKVQARTTKKINYQLGDIVRIKGNVIEPDNEKVFNLFSYKKYLLSKRIYKIIDIDSIKLNSKNNNIIYKIKNNIINRLNSINNSYLKAFIIGINDIDDKNKDNYQNNGISHLFAISGMHVGLFSTLILIILNLLFKKKYISYIITSIILIIYALLINTLSVFRSVIIFILLFIKKIFNKKIETYKLILLLIYIFLFINPFYIYDIGFKYSFIISYFLIKYNNLFNKKNYIIRLFYISIISLLVSFPITINNNFNINILSIINNIIFVPFISFIIFPFSLIVFIFPNLLNIYNILINILEYISNFVSNYSIIFKFSYMNIYMILIYYSLVYLVLNKPNIRRIILLLIYLIIHNNIYYFNNDYKITYINVNQGDSTLLQLKNKTILIDTGGNINYDISENIIIPYLDSLGIKKIDYLILTHGDYDHMGSSITLVNNFNIEKVLFNIGEYNDLEQKLINILNVKKIKYYQNINKLDINNKTLYFLNNRLYDNENDNSNIIYLKIDNYKFLFMGDASINVENNILNNYNLDNIDFLKIGHHGSKTSSSNYFINKINPKYSIISVGKNNRYGHPNKEVIDILNNKVVYRTDINGSIKILLKNDKFKIKLINKK